MKLYFLIIVCMLFYCQSAKFTLAWAVPQHTDTITNSQYTIRYRNTIRYSKVLLCNA